MLQQIEKVKGWVLTATDRVLTCVYIVYHIWAQRDATKHLGTVKTED